VNAYVGGNAQISALGADVLGRSFDTLAHDVLDRSQRDDPAAAARRLHLKAQNAAVVPLDGQTLYLADRGGLGQVDPVHPAGVG
jgi:hypothetical protein